MLGFTYYFILIFLFISKADAAKILGVFHLPGPSHYLAGSTLMKILAEKGHDVTVVAAFSEKNPPKNYKQVVLTGLLEEAQKKQISMFDITMNSFVGPIVFSYVIQGMIEGVFNNTEFKKFMESDEKFDAVIMEQFDSEAIKYIAHRFDAPLIVYNAMDANEWINQYQGNPDSPAYLPSVFLPYPSAGMSFFQRLHNSIIYVYTYLVRNLFTIPMQNRLLHKYYPDAPHLNEFIYNVSLVLLNADTSVYEPLPKVPSLVSIGGFHIKKPKPLPEDLQKVLDNAKNGVIYFSLGSNLKSKLMPVDKREILLKAFSELKETVIWKFEDEELPGKPDNVVIKKWLPQNDILAHKNVKLFITHGGIFSTIEAVYHGVPLLALPVMSEQELNSKRAQANGYAKFIPFRQITKDGISSYLQELLNNPMYKENAKKRSQILTDKPVPPAEAVNYWVEYVVRHKGAPHLRVAALNLSWYQYLLLDVVAFVIVLIIVFMYSLKYLLKYVFRRKNIKKEKIN